LNTSVAGSTGTAGASAYSATKADAALLARTAAAELVGRGIRVERGFAPGPIVRPSLAGPGCQRKPFDEFAKEMVAKVPMKRFDNPRKWRLSWRFWLRKMRRTSRAWKSM